MTRQEYLQLSAQIKIHHLSYRITRGFASMVFFISALVLRLPSFIRNPESIEKMSIFSWVIFFGFFLSSYYCLSACIKGSKIERLQLEKLKDGYITGETAGKILTDFVFQYYFSKK